MEVLVVLVILGVSAKIAVDSISSTDAALRADRAARECLTAVRYARSQAFTSGNTCGVRFNTSTKTFYVWRANTPGTAMSTNLFGNGTYTVDLTNNIELKGVTMTVTLSGASSNPYDLSFTTLGATSNTGTIVFTYAGKSKTVTIPAVGDPTLN
jgi:Tfp pilus assembly protein FimT